ncbi:hypothetical protein LX80_02406 [Hydrotalea sandarakina]|jgi:hypothetical protein|uniref:Uncharacterized protein n=1 Tax=Hydrotalea sandarakina TaxID=1004304 RepID=A0A2W7TCD9_9BACT|nr:hypothetical protein LX80_02406 [Hydrotalea sandarakina]
MKSKNFIPLIIYLLIAILSVIFRKELSDYISKDVLFVIASIGLIILALFVILARFKIKN